MKKALFFALITGSVLTGASTIVTSPVSAEVIKKEQVIIVRNGVISSAYAVDTKCSILASAIKGRLMLTGPETHTWCLFYTYNDSFKVQRYALHLSGPNLQHYSFSVYGNGSKCNTVGRKVKQRIESNTSLRGIKYMCLLTHQDYS